MKIRLRPARQLCLLFIFVFGYLAVNAQDYYLPVNNLSLLRMERGGFQRQKSVHFGLKPIMNEDINYAKVDGIDKDTAKYYYWYTEKLFSDHLVEFRKKDFKVNADFIFDFGYGSEFKSPEKTTNTYINQRGFAISAQIGKRVFLYTDFREIQTRVPNYLKSFADSLDVLPGSPQYKVFKETGYDYNMANGYVGVRAANWLDLSLGHYEQFVGFGHRSLILSDNSFNYPFASYNIHPGKGKLQFRYTIGLLQNLDRLPIGQAPEALFKRKYFNMNYLSYKVLDNLEIGLAEVTVWKQFDDSTGTEPFNYQSINPIPGLNTLVNGFASDSQNSLLGLNVAWHPSLKLSIYGQAVLDNPEKDKYAFQLGAKYRKIFNRIDLNLEYNHVEPFTYSSQKSLQSFTHNNQALTHPMGAGFDEYLFEATYYFNRVLFTAEVIYADYSDVGRAILKPEAEQNISTSESLNYQNFRFAYVFNPKTNMQVYAGFTNRQEDLINAVNTNQFWYFGIRTDLYNVYRDF